MFSGCGWTVTGGRRAPEEAAPQPGGAPLQQGRLSLPEPEGRALRAAAHAAGAGGLRRVRHGR